MNLLIDSMMQGLGLGYIIKDGSIHVNITSFSNRAAQYAAILNDTLREMKQVLDRVKQPGRAKL
jgi:hypothetical protein